MERCPSCDCFYYCITGVIEQQPLSIFVLSPEMSNSPSHLHCKHQAREDNAFQSFNIIILHSILQKACCTACPSPPCTSSLCRHLHGNRDLKLETVQMDHTQPQGDFLVNIPKFVDYCFVNKEALKQWFLFFLVLQSLIQFLMLW